MAHLGFCADLTFVKTLVHRLNVSENADLYEKDVCSYYPHLMMRFHSSRSSGLMTMNLSSDINFKNQFHYIHSPRYGVGIWRRLWPPPWHIWPLFQRKTFAWVSCREARHLSSVRLPSRHVASLRRCRATIWYWGVDRAEEGFRSPRGNLAYFFQWSKQEKQDWKAFLQYK